MSEDSKPAGQSVWGIASTVIAIMVVCGAGYIIFKREDLVHNQAAFICRSAACLAAACLGLALGIIGIKQGEKKLLAVIGILIILLALLATCAVFGFIVFILWGLAIH
jgi:uncharacterized membrane protein